MPHTCTCRSFLPSAHPSPPGVFCAPAPVQYERYQPGYERIKNEEIPDMADPPDGRFWKAGVAQGVTTHPYEKRLAISGEPPA